MQNIYHRSSGEVVSVPPEMITDPMPDLSSLPISAYCDPSTPVGWVENCREQWQVFKMSGWWNVSKETYIDWKPGDSKRIFLVPEQKESEEKGRKPITIVCTRAYEFEGVVFNVGDISDSAFGLNIPDNWRKATQQDIDNYLNKGSDIEFDVWKEMLIVYDSLHRMEENSLRWNIRILMKGYKLVKK